MTDPIEITCTFGIWQFNAKGPLEQIGPAFADFIAVINRLLDANAKLNDQALTVALAKGGVVPAAERH